MDACTIVISRSNAPDAERHDFEETLAGRCAAEGLHTLVVPDLYHVPPDANLILALRAIREPIVLFSWHWPRAAFWTLRQFGVRGVRADALSDDFASEELRPIVSHNLADKCCPDRWLDHVQELLGGQSPGGSPAVERLDEAVGERWYPVIDYERCTGCRECLEFCLFGVYEIDDEDRVVASQPDACKPGCPACSRVCPSQAIMFPLHETDEAIAGSDEGSIQAFDPGLPSVDELKRQYEEGKVSIQDVLRACGCKAKSLPSERGAACCPDREGDGAHAEDKDRGYFDRLIDGLVKD